MLYYIAIIALIAYTGLFIYNCICFKPGIKEIPILFIAPMFWWLLGAYILIGMSINKLRGK